MPASYVQGLSTTPRLGLTIGAALDRAARDHAGRDALIVRAQNLRLTYAELKTRVDACAAGLIALGLEPGDRIGIFSPNNAEWAILQFASAKAGLILVTINPAYRISELEFVLNEVQCKALVLARRFKSSDYIAMLDQLTPEQLPHLELRVAIGNDPAPAGMIRFADIAEAATPDSRARLETLSSTLQFDDPINIQFTSGTTGAPKGATLSHNNILNNGYFVGEACKLRVGDRIGIPVPLYHCFGMVMGNLAAITHGAAMIYPAEGFDPRATLEAVAAERCTHLYGVPTMFIAELDHPDFASFDLSSLRGGIMAGTTCPIEVMRKVIERMHMNQLTICYGMTETSPVSFQSATDDTPERRVATVGRIHPHLEVKLIDTDGRIVERGERGEICTRGYSVMLGYWGQEAKTREAIDEAGWMHTGDLGVIDNDGYCTIVGRSKDIVIRGGENIYPREVEEFLFRHPKIASASVFAVPDAKYGEVPCAWIKPAAGETLTEAEILLFCDGQIAHYKIPRYIKIVDEFPMTVTGKIQKFIMRDTMIAELGLNKGEVG
ncbi:AMP-binding protein [Acidiphilium sp. AL]|uniref:AMP-binding protein n=1 Tax=Acidiphilium iwatense TaxID=768198 RepID=A0ABS9DUC4_9PROT|nr:MULTISPECIES: AMP-binding protein [Acidiphilium]MCF3946297.1 AMP-binding protein [Acidiphilium iwatense]MCU4159918.1 AMP-binding protein [Acidiphilium sp. AL]